jgi:hypothetical protein
LGARVDSVAPLARLPPLSLLLYSPPSLRSPRRGGGETAAAALAAGRRAHHVGHAQKLRLRDPVRRRRRRRRRPRRRGGGGGSGGGDGGGGGLFGGGRGEVDGGGAHELRRHLLRSQEPLRDIGEGPQCAEGRGGLGSARSGPCAQAMPWAAAAPRASLPSRRGHRRGASTRSHRPPPVGVPWFLSRRSCLPRMKHVCKCGMSVLQHQTPTQHSPHLAI